MQPMSSSKFEGLSDLDYDLVTVLANCGKAVAALGDYIEDATLSNSPECRTLFEQIREDEVRHCDMLRNIIREQAKLGKF
jgi:hypothetical protein